MSDRPQHRDGPPVALTDDAIFDALIEHSKDNAAATGAAKQAIQRITILRHAQTDTNEAASARARSL